MMQVELDVCVAPCKLYTKRLSGFATDRF